MRIVKGVFIIILGFFMLTGYARPVYATSEQAYKDYIYQYDKYRTSYNEFKIAKNEYDKFRTLTSQTTVLEKTKVMLNWRDTLLRAYLLFLKEKLNENIGVTDTNKELYNKIITNETLFLENHAQLIPSIGTISDAVVVSNQLQSHYMVLQSSIRQVILGLSIGHLNLYYKQLGDNMITMMDILNQSRAELPLHKQSVADRWVVSINSKKNLYEQKIDRIGILIAGFSGDTITDMDRKMS